MKMSEILNKKLCFICGSKTKNDKRLSDQVGSELMSCDICGSTCNNLEDFAKFYYIFGGCRVFISFDKRKNVVNDSHVKNEGKTFALTKLDIDYDNFEIIDNLLKKYEYDRLL